MRIPLLHRLPFLSGSHREATPNPLDFRPLPSGTDKADAKVWTERLGDAQRLLGEMKRDIDLSVARAAQRPVQSMAAPMRAISPLTLLKTLLPGQKRGEAPAPELHANRVAQGAVVMAAPRDKEAVLWAAACVQHHIGHVVDLSTFPESQAIGSCMGRGDHRTRGRLIARFDAQPTFGEVATAHKDVKMDRVQVALSGAKHGEDFGTQNLLWTRVPISAGHAISPRLLLDLCRHLERQPLPRGESVAFQCADGGDRGAVFAAAHALHQRFRAGSLDRHNLQDAVQEACGQLRLKRDVALFGGAESIASLLSFGDLLIGGGGGPRSILKSTTSTAARAPVKTPVTSGDRRIRFNETTEVQGFSDRSAAKRSLGRFNGALGAPLEQLKEEKNLNRGRRKG
ncbi:hypothetical protein CDN99_15065 [Roseateles aquatilis]|uniref:Uncharacterized protein n=1 Tax=Roseateles aquatilis TaxID=431061 RepID=A0A246J8G8_9BURK|nr:hypothetical protein [Roseateles aquatilis]OWQ88799.1 hypothetical protein CDN99_15065 [Roseateles aquatilis]